MQTSQMGGARIQQSGLGQSSSGLLAVLLLLSLLPQQAKAAQPARVAGNITQTAVPLSEICGRTGFQGKIFGGQKAKPERWPWQASLRLYGRHICGAVLIDKNWVTSAAHCFQRSHNPSDYQIWLGYNQLNNPTQYSVEMAVRKLIVHRDYDKFHRQGSDIVLMQLSTPVEYNAHVLPACVPERNTKLPMNKPCWTSGWGMLTESEFLPHPIQMQEVQLILMENQICASFFPPPRPGSTSEYYIYEDMVCAADYAMSKSICRGDSGGPLVCLMNGTWYLVGLTSWSTSCEEPIVSPSVFTRVSYFANWIKENKDASPDPGSESKPGYPKPPRKKKPSVFNWINQNEQDQGTVMKPTSCAVLLFSQVLLLRLI